MAALVSISIVNRSHFTLDWQLVTVCKFTCIIYTEWLQSLFWHKTDLLCQLCTVKKKTRVKTKKTGVSPDFHSPWDCFTICLSCQSTVEVHVHWAAKISFQDIISDSRCSINVEVIALWFKDTGYNSLFRFYPAGEWREFLVVPCWDKTGEKYLQQHDFHRGWWFQCGISLPAFIALLSCSDVTQKG